jgi:transcriptional regulator with XRE-family HTH domain
MQNYYPDRDTLSIMESRHMTREGETMGTRFQRLREEARMTQVEAAERSGVPLSTLRHWEQGIRLPRIDLAIKLARALGVDLNTLAGFDEPPAEKTKRGRKQ